VASGILQEMTLDEVREFRPEVVLLGVGSTEPHGPALPYGTDFFRADELCRRAAARANELGARVLVYPTLPVGNNVNMKAFPFACRIGVRTLMLAILDVIKALEEDGVRKIAIVNAHGGNTDALRAALREHFDLTAPERRAFVCLVEGTPAGDSPRPPADAEHGGEGEISIMMHISPELVRAGKIREHPMGKIALESLGRGGVYFVRPWHRHVPACAGGRPQGSTPRKGADLMEAGVEGLARLLAELSAAAWSPDFPYPRKEE